MQRKFSQKKGGLAFSCPFCRPSLFLLLLCRFILCFFILRCFISRRNTCIFRIRRFCRIRLLFPLCHGINRNLILPNCHHAVQLFHRNQVIQVGDCRIIPAFIAAVGYTGLIAVIADHNAFFCRMQIRHTLAGGKGALLIAVAIQPTNRSLLSAILICHTVPQRKHNIFLIP